MDYALKNYYFNLRKKRVLCALTLFLGKMARKHVYCNGFVKFNFKPN